MDKIIARGLKFKGCHGVYPQEKTTAQNFVVDLELSLDLQPAGREDRLDFTVDYGKLFQLVRDIIEGPSFNLIEALAEHIAGAILKHFPVQAAEVTVFKPEAPVEGDFDYFAVRVRRER